MTNAAHADLELVAGLLAEAGIGRALLASLPAPRRRAAARPRLRHRNRPAGAGISLLLRAGHRAGGAGPPAHAA